MSHITKVTLKVRDLDALDEAAQAVGLELRRGKTRYAWWGRFVGDSHAYGDHDPQTFGHGEHAIGRPGVAPKDGGDGEWEIGVVKALDGDGYDLLFDSWGTPGHRLTRLAGDGLKTLEQAYAASVATKRAKAKLRGWTATTQRVGGRVRVELVKR